jgi:hypothetical protein
LLRIDTIRPNHRDGCQTMKKTRHIHLDPTKRKMTYPRTNRTPSTGVMSLINTGSPYSRPRRPSSCSGAVAAAAASSARARSVYVYV